MSPNPFESGGTPTWSSDGDVGRDAVPPQRDRPASPEAFVRSRYRDLVRILMVLGASMDEATEAIAETLVELVQRWDDLTHPFAWARRAALSNFIKEKQRGPGRVRQKLVEQAAASPEGRDDPELTVWEDNEWITQLLKGLPPKQREVLALVLDGFAPAEIAELLGRTPAAVRQNLHEARKRLRLVLRGESADESGPDSGDD